MAKRCPPGVICVQNMVFMTVFLSLLAVIAFVVYRSTGSNQSTGVVHPVPNSSSEVGRSGWFDGTVLQGLFPRPSYSFSNVESDVLMNPYAPPLKDERLITRDIRGGVPINVSTSAVDAEYRQIGILTKQNGDESILPLMGRPLFTNRDKWQFYTMNERNIKLPVVYKGKSCTNEYGCDNVSNGDMLYVEGIGQPFKVTIYDNATMKYIPFV